MAETENRIETGHWHGRDGADGRIYCTRNGFRKDVWERRDGRWEVVKATLFPVVGFYLKAPGFLSPIFGEGRDIT